MPSTASLARPEEVDAFVDRLFAKHHLQPRPSANVSAAPRGMECDGEGAAAGCSYELESLRRENALYLGVIMRLQAIVLGREGAPASGPSAAASAEVERLSVELAACKAAMASQAAELRAALAAARHAEQVSVQRQVDGMQSQIEDLRHAVRELSVQASQSRAASAAATATTPSPPPASPECGRVVEAAPLHNSARDHALQTQQVEAEVAALRQLVAQQQQTIAALRRREEDADGGIVWQDPEPEWEDCGAPGSGRHSPSRASGRIVYAGSDGEAAHDSRDGSSSAAPSHGSDEPEPAAPAGAHRRGSSEDDKENYRPVPSTFAHPQRPRPQQRRVQMRWDPVVEEISHHLDYRRSDGSEATGGSGITTPPPRATILLNGAGDTPLDDQFRASKATVASPEKMKSTAEPSRGSGGPDDAPEADSSSASSEVSYVGRKPRGTISLSMPRRSFSREGSDGDGGGDDSVV